MALITLDGQIVPDPRWQTPEGHQAEDRPQDVLLDLHQWRETVGNEAVPEGVDGVLLQPEDTLTDLLPWLDRLHLVALNFPRAGDGRPYSMARQLRWRDGYKGELRAVGDIQVDQLAAMRRCGFDSFELSTGDLATQTARYLQGPRAYPHWQDPAPVTG